MVQPHEGNGNERTAGELNIKCGGCQRRDKPQNGGLYDMRSLKGSDILIQSIKRWVHDRMKLRSI